jgi:hypothetical protein
MRLKGRDKFWDRKKENRKRGEMSEVCMPSIGPVVKLTMGKWEPISAMNGCGLIS